METFIISLLSALGFRIRGGLGERWGWKFPLNKWWFALIFSLCASYLHGWNQNYQLVLMIASRISTQIAGWGEYVGCVLGLAKPQPDREDLPKVDHILDNMKWDAYDCELSYTFHIWFTDIYIPISRTIHIPAFNLLDYPVLFGWLGLSIRGLYMTFIIGLALQSIPFMICGLAMGTIYWLVGLFSRKVYPLYKGGWNIAELAYGFYLGLMLCLIS